MTFWPHQKLTPAAFNRILDWVERSVVLILFAYFVLRMMPRLAQLIIVQMNYPELILRAAGINAQAALLIVSDYSASSLFLPGGLHPRCRLIRSIGLSVFWRSPCRCR
jgi:hypothetical protein